MKNFYQWAEDRKIDLSEISSQDRAGVRPWAYPPGYSGRTLKPKSYWRAGAADAVTYENDPQYDSKGTSPKEQGGSMPGGSVARHNPDFPKDTSTKHNFKLPSDGPMPRGPGLTRGSGKIGRIDKTHKDDNLHYRMPGQKD